jgi:dihydrolipoamide dehydrogenase
MALIDIQVPDIGDFDEVAVIELLVKPGDTVKAEQSLITVESDKASMEIPSSQAGVVKELKVKLGDKVKQGSLVLTLEAAGEAAAAPAASAPAPAPQAAPAAAPVAAAPVAAPTAASFGGSADLECDVVVLGGGPGGYSAAFRAADLGLKVVHRRALRHPGWRVPERGLHSFQGAAARGGGDGRGQPHGGAGRGVRRPVVNIEKLRGHKEKVIGKLTGGLAAMAKMRKVTTVRGVGSFVGANHLEVEETTGATGQEKTGKKQVIGFKKAIIAAGSQAVRLPFMPDDPRVVDSTGALALKEVPKRMLILGGGIIGLEMGTVYSTLGARLDVVEMLDGLMQGADRDLVKIWQKMNAPRFDNIMLKTKTVSAKATPAGIEVTFESAEPGGTAPAPQTYDLVLQAVGRTPNGKKIGAEKAGVAVTDRGFINVDIQMRTNVPNIFAIGDIVGQPMLAHKAVHEAHVAAEVIAGELQGNKELASAAFNARVIPSVAYTDPEVAWVGLTEDQAKAQGIKVKKGLFPWTASGRAIANGRDEGVTKLLFDDSPEAHGHGKILGGGMVGTHAGDMIGEIALAIEMGADAVDIGKTIHPHPTLGESIGMAAEIAHGSCTDVPPQRK